MADRSIKINLGANVAGFSAGMKTAQKAVLDLTGATDAVTAATRKQAQAALDAEKAEKALKKVMDSAESTSVEKAAATAKLEQSRERLSDATRDLAQAQKSLGLGGWVEKNSAAIDDLAGKTAILGGSLTAMAGLAVKKFADFDQAMSSVASTGDDARGSMDALRQASIDAGADTAFSATEAAGAVEELAKAGVSAKDILGGGLKGSLDLAAAGGLGVAEAAEYASIAMTQFKLSGQDVGHVADLLAAGAGKAMGDVSDLGQALKQGGLVAAATGLTIEETTGALSAFAAAGLLGSDAGTSLKTMLQRLSAPADEASDLMKSLGISAYDASGEFVGMEAFAGQLTRALGDMTPAQRNATMATIFGADAVRAANIVYENGAQGIADWIAAVDDQGYAAETAAVKLDNLKGDLEALGGSLETLLIGMGEGADGPLRSLVQGLDGVVDSLNRLPDPIKQGTLLLAGGSGLALLGLAGMAKLTTSIVATKASMEALGISTARTKGAMVALGKAAAVVGVGVVAKELMSLAAEASVGSAEVDKLAQDFVSLAEGGKAANGTLDEIFRNQTAMSWLPWVKEIEGAQQATEEFATSAYEALATGFFQKIDRFVGGGSDMAKFEKQVGQLDAAFADLVDGGSADIAAEQYRAFTAAAVEQGVEIEALAKFFPQYSGALEAAAAANVPATATAEEHAAALEEQALSADEAWKAIKGLSDGLLGIRNAEVGFEAALDAATDSIKENGRTLDINTEKGRANRTALDNIASSGWAWVDQMREQGATDDELRAKMQRTRDEYIEVARKMGMSEKAAKKLADQLGLIPGRITSEVEVDTSDATRKLNAWIDAAQRRQVSINIGANAGGTGRTGQTAKATGGSVVGPGTGTSDSIPALLSNGEHVLTASDVAKAGGQGAVYRMRGLIQAGALRFARGGMVSISGGTGNAGDSVTEAKARVQRERRQVKAAEKAVERAQSASTRASRASADTSSKDKAAKARAKREARDAADAVKAARKRLAREKAQLKAAEKALAEARKVRADEKERRSDIRDLRAEHETDVRRGTIRDQVSSGLSGGLSAVDSMLALANSGTLSKGKSAELRAVAKQAEKDLTAQYAILERTNAKIAEQTALLGDVKGMRDQISQQMMGEVKLADTLSAATSQTVQHSNGRGDVWYSESTTGGGTSAGAIRAYLSDKLTKARTFNSKLDALRKKGAPNALLQEVLGAGIEGGTALASALLGSSASDWRSITSTWTALESESRRTGDIGTLSAFGTTTAAVEADLAKQVAIAEGTQDIILSIGRLLESTTGGVLQGYKAGGWITGGIAGRDSVPIMTMPGEHVTNAVSARYNANLLERINATPGPVAAPLVAVPVAAGVGAGSAPVYVTIPDIYVRNPLTGEDVLAASRQMLRTELSSAANAMQRGY